MSEKDRAFMQSALEAAYKGVNKGQAPFGASIVKNDKVIVSAHNIVWQSMDITAHAEINAIRKACKELNTIDLTGCVIYSTCEPCPMCFSAIHWAKIKKIVFGTGIMDAEKFGFSELPILNETMRDIGKTDIEIIGDFIKKEAVELFEYWSEKHGDKTY